MGVKFWLDFPPCATTMSMPLGTSINPYVELHLHNMRFICTTISYIGQLFNSIKYNVRSFVSIVLFTHPLKQIEMLLDARDYLRRLYSLHAHW